MRPDPATASDLRSAILKEFPELRGQIDLDELLVHLDALALGAHAEKAKRAGDWPTYSRCVALVDGLWPRADAALRNALATSFLEHLGLDGAAGAEARRLLSPQLRQARSEADAGWAKLDQLRRGRGGADA